MINNLNFITLPCAKKLHKNIMLSREQYTLNLAGATSGSECRTKLNREHVSGPTKIQFTATGERSSIFQSQITCVQPRTYKNHTKNWTFRLKIYEKCRFTILSTERKMVLLTFLVNKDEGDSYLLGETISDAKRNCDVLFGLSSHTIILPLLF